MNVQWLPAQRVPFKRAPSPQKRRLQLTCDAGKTYDSNGPAYCHCPLPCTSQRLAYIQHLEPSSVSWLTSRDHSFHVGFHVQSSQVPSMSAAVSGIRSAPFMLTCSQTFL